MLQHLVMNSYNLLIKNKDSSLYLKSDKKNKAAT